MSFHSIRRSVTTLSLAGLVLLSFFLWWMLGEAALLRDAQFEEVGKIKKDIQIVRTLSTEGPKDVRDVDLLEKLTGYCFELGIPAADCSVKTQTPTQNEEYSSLRYSIYIQKILMDKALDYYQKLEGLPDNVRVLSSALRRMENKAATSEEERLPFLLLKIEMNEIKFR